MAVKEWSRWVSAHQLFCEISGGSAPDSRPARKSARCPFCKAAKPVLPIPSRVPKKARLIAFLDLPVYTSVRRAGEEHMADFNLRWHGSLHLKPCQTRVYKVDLELIPDEPGIYIFLRAFGATKLPMYLGQATNLQRRIKQQLETNVRLMTGIQNSPNGGREVVFGVFEPRRGQQLSSSLDRIERALIRHDIRSGYQLFNTHGTKVAMETLTSERSQNLNKLIPRTLSFEKTG